MIPDPSGQLAELIVYITSTRVDLYSHQVLLVQNLWVAFNQCWYIVSNIWRNTSEDGDA